MEILSRGGTNLITIIIHSSINSDYSGFSFPDFRSFQLSRLDLAPSQSPGASDLFETIEPRLPPSSHREIHDG